MNLITETFYDAEQKIWSGPKIKRKYEANTTLGEVILEVLQRDPEKIMQISDTTGEQKTAAQLSSDSKSIAQYFISQGLKPGDVVGLFSRNTTNVAAVVIASLLCGTPFNAAYANFDKENLMIVYKMTMPKIIFCETGNYETLKEAVKDMGLNAKIVTLNGKLPSVDSIDEIIMDNRQKLNDAETRFPCIDFDSDTTAVIFCSSGTTGGIKAINCSHRALLEHQVFLNISPNDVILNFTTFYWISGVWVLFASLLNGITRIITESILTPEYFYYLLEKYNVTHSLISSGQVAELCNHADPNSVKYFKNIKYIIVGGGKLNETIMKKFMVVIGNEPKLNICYGLSECGTMVSETQFNTPVTRYDCEGKLMPNIEAKIIDETTGNALGPNEKGTLHIRFPFKWAGYYRNEEATKKVYTPDGWLNTGDIVYFDNEGFLIVCARDSDVFRNMGFTIFPNKLENLILQLPGVAEVCVFPKPDLVAESLTACAIVRTNDEVGRLLTENVVSEHVNKHFMKLYQINGGIYFVKSLPKTVNGKVQRRKIFELIENGTL